MSDSYLIESVVGEHWMKTVSQEELDAFIRWARGTQVYFYPGNERNLGDAFRGFCTGLMFNRGDRDE